MMIKSRSIGIIHTTKNSHSQNQLHLDSPYHPSEDYALDSIRHASQILQSTPQSCVNGIQPIERCKKSIKLRVNNNFPSDFFSNPSYDMSENRACQSPGLPVRLINHNTPRHIKNLTMEDSASKQEIREFSPQLVIACSPTLREDRIIIRKVQCGFESEKIKSSALNSELKDDRSCSIEKSRADSGLARMKIRPFLEGIKLHAVQTNTQNSEQSEMSRESVPKRRSFHQKPLSNMLRADSLVDLKKQNQRGPSMLVRERSPQESISRPFDSTRDQPSTNHHMPEEMFYSYNSSRQGTVYKQKINVSCIPLHNRQKKNKIMDKPSPRNNLGREKIFDFMAPASNRTHRTNTSRELTTLPVLSPVRVFEAPIESVRGNAQNDIESTNNTDVLQENKQEVGSRVISSKALVKFHKSIIKPINLKSVKFGPIINTKSSVTRRIELVDQEQDKENIVGTSVVTPIRKNRKTEIMEQKPNNHLGEGLTHSVSAKGLEFSFSNETNNHIEGFSENLCQKVLDNLKARSKFLQGQSSHHGHSITLGSQSKGVKVIKIQKRSSLAK